MHMPDPRAGHRILIVDDDRIIRRYIMELITSVAPDLDAIVEAPDGHAALEMLNDVLPGIALVDMRMPRMDGLGFVHAAHARHPWIQCFILSNYDEFEMVKGAFKGGVADYVLKYAVEAGDLVRIIDQGRAALAAYAQRRALELQLERTRRTADMARLGETVRGGFWPKEAPSGALWCTVLGGFTSGENWHERALATAMDALSDRFEGFDRFSLPEGLGSALLHIGLCAPEGQRNDALAGMMIRDAAAALVSAFAEAGFICACAWTDAPIDCALKSLKDAARQVFYLDGCEAFPLSSHAGFRAAPRKEEYDSNPETCAELARRGGVDAALALLRESIAAMRKDQLDPADARCVLLRYHAALGSEQRLFALDNLKTAAHALEAFVRTQASRARVSADNPGIDRAIQYIQNHLSDAMTLEEVARHSGYSRNHFCRIFKQSTGTGFNTYLNAERMELAGALLCKGIQVQEVARRVGFSDARYFRRVFEKFMGMPISTWRNRKGVGTGSVPNSV